MIFQIHHYTFATDNMVATTSLAEASSKEEALIKYNKLAVLRKDYPYFWNQAELRSVFLPEIIT